MRVYISADMEGVTGVCHRDHLVVGGQDYERARRWLTGDVNAAVEGALEGGADDVVVADGHATMRNILLDELHEAARLVTGPAQARNRALGQIAGLEAGPFQAAFLVGYHSRAGAPGGLLSHTWVGALVHEIRLQQRPAGEALLNAALLGHHGIPVLLATGADDFCREARADLGEGVELAEVKRTLGPTACLSLAPARSRRVIREAAARALRRRPLPAPLRVGTPVLLEVEFHRREMRDRAQETGGTPTGDRGLRFEGSDPPTAVAALWRSLEEALREDAAFLK